MAALPTTFVQESVDTTVVVEATDEPNYLVPQITALFSAEGAKGTEVIIACPQSVRTIVENTVGLGSRNLSIVLLAAGCPEENSDRVLRQVKTDKIAFLPARNSLSAPDFTPLPNDEEYISILLDRTLSSSRLEQKSTKRSPGWLASAKLIRTIPALRFPSDWNLVRLDALLRERHCAMTWPSLRSPSVIEANGMTAGDTPVLNLKSSVLALIPHYRCEEWLESSIASLVGQTRPLDGIVVIDDCSPVPPVELIKKFPGVTLLTATETVGPYRLKQEVINSTSYDGYLLQDADDWSANSRLELLLAEAERTGADIVGSQEVRFYCDREEVIPIEYPGDVNAGLARGEPECDPLLHPTCLVSRDIMMRMGGFATGLRFGGDAEFLLRATYTAKMVNIPYFSYFRRRRADSLTMAPETGIRSQARRELSQALDLRGQANDKAVAMGNAPDLKPAPMAGPVELVHLLGPRLKTASDYRRA